MSTYKDIYKGFYTLASFLDVPLGNSKIDFINSNKDNEVFMYLLRELLDPTSVYGIKKIQEVGLESRLDATFEDFVQWVETLKSTNMNNKLLNRLVIFTSKFPYDLQPIVIKFFCKTLKVGVTLKSVNKIIPDFLEEFYCMLADTSDEIEFPVIVDLKYDGVRCLAFVKDSKCTLYTRQGNIINIPDISDEFIKLANGSNYVFDCELITNLRTDVAGKINSILKTGYTIEKATGIIAMVFDVVDYDTFKHKRKSAPLIDRLKLLELLISSKEFVRLKKSVGAIHNSYDTLKPYIKSLIDIGEEGVIIKKIDGTYDYKRSTNWIKVKAINSTTLRITGFTKGKNSRANKIGAITCESEDGLISVDVGSGLTHKDLDLINDDYIGRYVEVIFNTLIKGKSNKYSLFLPRFKNCDWLRIDKVEADTLEKVLKEHIGKPMI